MGAPVVHFEVHLKNDKNKEFYSKLFNWKIDSSNPMNYGVVDTDSGGQGIAGGISPPQSDEGPMVTFYVQVKDLGATLKKAEQMGGKTVMPPMDIPGMVSMAMFADPDGNVIGLVLPEPPPA